MKTASWIILVLIGAATLLLSLNSLRIAYSSAQDRIGPATLTELSQGRPELATAIRARRATAASYAAGFCTLFLAIVLVPYRRGDVWAWWALAAGMVVLAGLLLLRVPCSASRWGRQRRAPRAPASFSWQWWPPASPSAPAAFGAKGNHGG